MRVKNKTGFDVQIVENGKERVIPYDNQVYVVDDECYAPYKEFFQIIKPPASPEVLKKRREKKEKQRELDELKKKPLYGKRCKLSLRNRYRMRSMIGGERKGTKKNQWMWVFISPEGERFRTIDLAGWCKDHPGWLVPNIYKYVGAKYKGWQVKRRPRNPKKK
jgi:hypothetical protein